MIQVAFSTPGVKYPDDEIPDDQLMDSLKKLIDERTERQKQITELKDQVKQLTGQEKKGDKALKTLKQHVSDASVSRDFNVNLECSVKIKALVLYKLLFTLFSNNIKTRGKNEKAKTENKIIQLHSNSQ